MFITAKRPRCKKKKLALSIKTTSLCMKSAFQAKKADESELMWLNPSLIVPFAAAILVHPGPGSRSSFLDGAMDLVKANATGLLIDAP